MTYDEWLACTDARRLLHAFTFPDRVYHLFVVACTRFRCGDTSEIREVEDLVDVDAGYTLNYLHNRYGGRWGRPPRVTPTRERALYACTNHGNNPVFADILRDMVNPFHQPRIPDAWTRWGDCCVLRIAEGIYQDRAWCDVPILHDALLDAGCDDQRILDHLLEDGHQRGCWVLDHVLGYR